MIASLLQTVIKTVNLLEAEARLAKKSVFRLAASIVVYAAAAMLSLVGVLGIMTAILLGLSSVMSLPWALALVSSLILLLAIIGFLLVRNWMASTHSR